MLDFLFSLFYLIVLIFLLIIDGMVHRMDVSLHVITLYIADLLLEEGRETEINTSGIEVSQTLRILFELDVVIKYISMFPFILNHVLVKI